MLLTVPDSAGALAKAINVIAAFDLNMDNLQSRPVKSRPFEYYFFVQLAGHTSRQNVEACLQALSAVCTSVRSLGSYSIRKDDQL
ncbi:ACT domain-containing protein [Allobaculum sp. Allo2]|uniref:ACT domain-containing protein n=1 Tax=Allobaculum sp. Allo2 TaxID=2853432 RepID=UPI001F6093EC|nr:ACT domain-containing protein [Allobaculum sp. Allo2]